MDVDQQIEDLYKEIGIRCPFKLARRLDIKVSQYDLANNQLCGVYKSSIGGYRIYLNDYFDMPDRERALNLMIKQHLNYCGIALKITESDLVKITKVERSFQHFSRFVTEIFIKTVNQKV